MTAVPRDPDFWRRFSVAVHNSELELAQHSNASTHLLTPPNPALTASESSVKPKPSFNSLYSHESDVESQRQQHPAQHKLLGSSAGSTAHLPHHAQRKERPEKSWLEAERSKQRRGKWLLPLFFFGVIALIVLVVLVLIWLSSHGWFAHGEKVTVP